MLFLMFASEWDLEGDFLQALPFIPGIELQRECSFTPSDQSQIKCITLLGYDHNVTKLKVQFAHQIEQYPSIIEFCKKWRETTDAFLNRMFLYHCHLKANEECLRDCLSVIHNITPISDKTRENIINLLTTKPPTLKSTPQRIYFGEDSTLGGLYD